MENVSLKQIGQNIIFTNGDEVLSKKFTEKEEREEIKTIYKELKSCTNKKKATPLINKIKKYFNKNTEKKKEKVKVVKVVEKKLKKEAKKQPVINENLIAENERLKKENEDLTNKVNQSQSYTSHKTRRGE